MTIIVQAPAEQSYSGTSVAKAYGSACTPGSYLIGVLTSEETGSGDTLGMSDPTNGAWAKDVDVAGTDHSRVAIFSVLNTASTALTVTGTTTSSQQGFLQIYEITGQAASPLTDTGSQGTSDAPSVTVTATENATIIAVAVGYPDVTIDTADSGYTLDIAASGVSFSYHSAESIADAGAAGDKTLTWSSGGDTERLAFAVAVYKDASGGGTAPTAEFINVSSLFALGF